MVRRVIQKEGAIRKSLCHRHKEHFISVVGTQFARGVAESPAAPVLQYKFTFLYGLKTLDSVGNHSK